MILTGRRSRVSACRDIDQARLALGLLATLLTDKGKSMTLRPGYGDTLPNPAMQPL